MEITIKLGEIIADVLQKDIKNVHLSVYPPNGHVRISAPLRMSLDSIRAYAATKLDWIKAQQVKLRDQDRCTPREFVSGESHFLWGKRYLLSVVEADARPRVSLVRGRIELSVRPGSTPRQREEIIESWMRGHLKTVIPPMIESWQARLQVEVDRFYVQHMKTKWGSCNPRSRAIRINTELAKKPVECLEYIVVHEMVHLIEPTHNDRFVTLMSQHFPKWKFYRDELNKLPVRHEQWKY